MQDIPLDVPTTLLKFPLIKNKDILDKKYEYDKVGSNASMVVEPAIVKFVGFEILKLNVIKVKVINKSPNPQRLYILPPKSEYFNIKYDKKGAIPTGMAEEIYVHFKPNEYKYYYDTIRINTQTETLLIPIHAFPALSRENLRELFPRLIDFGTVDIGDSQVNRYPLQCKIPINFEFEFQINKDHSDIKINPYKGIVPGKGIIEIEVTYTPSVNVTVVVEVELKISQMEFEPLPIKIMGSGRIVDGNKSKKRPSSNTKLASINIKREQSLLNELNEENLQYEQSPKVIYETEGQGQDQMKPLIKTVNTNKFTIRSRPAVEKEIVEFKMTQGTTLQGRQALEKIYLDHFNQISQLDKDKEIRFFQCIGDWPIKEETINQIVIERDNYWNKKLQDFKDKGVTRYRLELDQDSAVVDQVLPKYECQWDFDKNDTIKIKKLKLRKFVYAVTRVIYRIRFDNRLQKIKDFLKGATTREEVVKLVNQDWQKAEYTGLGKKDFVQFAFEFEESCIGKFTLPVQYQDSNTFSSFKFDINPRTSFDDWAPIDQIPQCDQEVMLYRNWDAPQLTIHPPLLQNLIFRDGAEEEKAIRGKMGPFQDLLSTDDSIESMRQLFSKPPDNESFALLQPHKTLKYYHQYEELNPLEPYYQLGFAKVEGIGGDLNPDISINHQVLKQEFINKAPGYGNLNLMYELNLEQYYYKERNMQLANDFGYEEQIEMYCPQLMAEKEPDDHLTDDDSDGEGPPQLQVLEVADFLKKIEQDDKNIQQYRGEIIDIQSDLETKINQNLLFEKTKWIATVPSKTNDFNKFTSNNVNKQIIL